MFGGGERGAWPLSSTIGIAMLSHCKGKGGATPLFMRNKGEEVLLEVLLLCSFGKGVAFELFGSNATQILAIFV